MLSFGKILVAAFALNLALFQQARAEVIFLRCDISMQIDDKSEGKKASSSTIYYRISSDSNTIYTYDFDRGDYYSQCESEKTGSVTSCDQRYSVGEQSFSFEVMRNLNMKASYQYGNVAINRSSGNIHGSYELYYIAEKVRLVTFKGTCAPSADLVNHQKKF